MKHSKIVIPFAAAALVAVVTLSATARQEPPVAKGPAKAAPAAAPAEKLDDKVVIQTQRWSYPLTTCPISGEKLGAKPTEFVVDGRLVRTCCGDCKAQIVKSPADAIKKIDAAVVAGQKATYPLQTCAVTDAKLDDKAVDYVYGTRLVRFCCKKCVPEFQKKPAEYLAKIDSAKKTM